MSSPSCRLSAADTGNQLLAQLTDDDWHRVEPYLERVSLAQGRRLQEAGANVSYVYFPTSAVVSLVSAMSDGGSSEVAVVGNEGVVGVCAFMGGGGALSDGVVQNPGHCWRIRAPVLATLAVRHETVLLPLLRYAQALFVQLAQASACHRHHSFYQQLCCWLLLHQDHHPNKPLVVTHQRIAELLGVRRETVTEGALKLQRSGLIRYARGHIAILNRNGLEDHSCECYAVVKSAYDKLRRHAVQSAAAAAPASRLVGGLRPQAASVGFVWVA
jgi:CRP-like cAMP-binding protein